MKLTHKELEIILNALLEMEYNKLREKNDYKRIGNMTAAETCTEQYYEIRLLEDKLAANRHDIGTEIAYELV